MNIPLCLSSLGFAGAGCVACWVGVWPLAVTSYLTSAASINFWRKEEDGATRHVIDQCMATVSFCIFTVYGFMRGTHLYAWPCWVGILASFCTSRYLQRRPGSLWVVPHVAFHALVTLGQVVVILTPHICRALP